jgi:probable HAF family extracellular repeat protein
MKRNIILVAACVLAAACDRAESFAPDFAVDEQLLLNRSGTLLSTSAFTSSWTQAVLPLIGARPNTMATTAAAVAINEDGWAVGTTSGNLIDEWWESTRATVWTPAGVHELGVLPPHFGTQQSRGHAINDLGMVVGESTGQNADGVCCVSRAFVWTAAGGMQALPLLAATASARAQAFGINNKGHVVGSATDGAGATRAVVWMDHALPPIPIGVFHDGRAVSINDYDVVVGTGSSGAFIWSPGGGVQPLGGLPGGGSLWPLGINNAGDVVGIGFMDSGDVRAILWTAASGFRDLGLPPGAEHAAARGINDAGRIAVSGQYSDGVTAWTKAFLWADGVWIALEEDDDSATPGSVFFTEVGGLNEKLQIAGSGFASAAGRRAVLWDVTLTPAVPEYSFDGFFAPISNLPVVNRAKAGQSVPVKFSLGGDHGLDIFAAGYPASQPIACDGNATTEPLEGTGTAGASSLSWDATTNQYTYVWKTERSWAGSCRRLTVRLADGSERSADFQFTR